MCVYRDWIYTSVFCPHPSIWCHFCANHALRNRILQEKLAFLLFAHQVFVVCFLVFTSKTEKKGTYFSHPGVIPFFLPAFVIKCVCCVSPSVERFRFSGGPLLEHSLWHCIFFRVFFIIRTSGTGMKGVTWSRTNIPGSRYLRVYNTFKCYADDVACAQQYACLNSYKPYISSSIR